MTLVTTGYHGTTKNKLSLIRKSDGFIHSPRKGLWLGTGAYFFEEAPLHAYSWAQNAATAEGSDPVVIEARIQLDNYIDLSDRRYWPLIQHSFRKIKKDDPHLSQIGPLAMWDPVLKADPEFGHNYVDHAVMDDFLGVYESIHSARGVQVDGVRAALVGGSPVYQDSWYFTRACIMLSVINLSAILSWQEVAIASLSQ